MGLEIPDTFANWLDPQISSPRAVDEELALLNLFDLACNFGLDVLHDGERFRNPDRAASISVSEQ